MPDPSNVPRTFLDVTFIIVIVYSAGGLEQLPWNNGN